MIYVAPLSSTTRLADHPRARLRLTLERSATPQLGIQTFDAAVQDTVDAIARSGTAVPMGYARPGAQDRATIVDCLIPLTSSPSESAGDVARAADTGSLWTKITRMELLPITPATSDTRTQEIERAQRDVEARRAEESAQASSPLTQIVNAVKSARGLFLLGVVAVIVVGGAYLVSQARAIIPTQGD
jgi:hypothetical protein